MSPWPGHDDGDSKEAAGRTATVNAIRNASIAPFSMKRVGIEIPLCHPQVVSSSA